ncbi:hypothetical protein MMC20_001548 [Loxospora ochrophaea]|nr:hypothetical protein [Loxospora ochrophaea]
MLLHPRVLVLLALPLLPLSVSSTNDVVLTSRQSTCNTAGFVPCNPQGSSDSFDVPSAAYASSDFWSSLDSAAADPTQRVKREIRNELAARQNALCCRPAPVECLFTQDDGVPFCYTPSTTRYFFSDGSYGFVSNGTYYGSDDTFVDYKTGFYSLPNGTNGTFTPVDAASASATANAATGFSGEDGMGGSPLGLAMVIALFSLLL